MRIDDEHRVRGRIDEENRVGAIGEQRPRASAVEVRGFAERIPSFNSY
jgi:hypothetical protein